MRDYTNPVATVMIILGGLLILAATTSANAESGKLVPYGAVPASDHGVSQVQQLGMLIRMETQLQMETQRATAIQMQAEQNAKSAAHRSGPGCVVCKID